MFTYTDEEPERDDVSENSKVTGSDVVTMATNPYEAMATIDAFPGVAVCDGQGTSQATVEGQGLVEYPAVTGALDEDRLLSMTDDTKSGRAEAMFAEVQ